MVDACGADHDKAISGQSFVWTHHHGVADDQIFDRQFDDLPVASHMGCPGGKLGQGLDRAFGAAHGVVFERVADAEQKQQESAFGPGPERRRTCGCDEHQGIDLEALLAEVLERFSHRKKAAEDVGDQEEGEGNPSGKARCEFLEGESKAQSKATCQGEDQLRIGA